MCSLKSPMQAEKDVSQITSRDKWTFLLNAQEFYIFYLISDALCNCDIISCFIGLLSTVLPRLHDTTGCQGGYTTNLTTGWMFIHTIQPVVKPVVKRV